MEGPHNGNARGRRALSIREFCDRYSIGRTRAYDEIASGRLRAVKAGRRTLIADDAAEAWLAALPDSKSEPKERKRAAATSIRKGTRLSI
jgi:excisionase family DNA binding protein